MLQALSHNAAGLRDRLDQMDARMLKLEQRMRSLVTEETAQPGARNQAHDPVPNLKRGGVRTGETAG